MTLKPDSFPATLLVGLGDIYWWDGYQQLHVSYSHTTRSEGRKGIICIVSIFTNKNKNAPRVTIMGFSSNLLGHSCVPVTWQGEQNRHYCLNQDPVLMLGRDPGCPETQAFGGGWTQSDSVRRQGDGNGRRGSWERHLDTRTARLK